MRRRIRPILPHPTDPTASLVELTRGYFAVISSVDAEAIGNRNWSVRPGRRTHYASAAGNLNLHRVIGAQMGLPLDLEIDHRDGNGLDCRRHNLRAATSQQNKANMTLSRANSTGAKGVVKFRDKFRARVAANGVTHDLGMFETVAEADAAARAARVRLHGEFANHGDENKGGKATTERVAEWIH